MNAIEISPKEYWKKLNYEDGIFYCQLLEIDGKNDWRILNSNDKWVSNTDLYYMSKWFSDREDYSIESGDDTRTRWVVPVRDI